MHLPAPLTTSSPARQGLRGIASLALAALLAACGGGGGDSAAVQTATRGAIFGGEAIVAGANVLTMRVDAGTDGSAINSPFVTVTVCQPGTSICESIDRVLVDTGSTGLRVAAGAFSAAFRAALPAVPAPGGQPAAACGQFASGFNWGSVRSADVRLASETAAAISVQVVDDPAPAYAQVASQCSSPDPNAAPRSNIRAGRGANGILGVGFLTRDCDAGASGINPCTFSAAPNVYFSCAPAGGCSPATMPAASQVSNPVASLPVNNNGVVLVLPAVPLGGVGSLAGSLVLGIGTQANNSLGSAVVIPASSQGYVTTVYNGTTYPNSFFDSGSNGLFFRDTTLPLCGDFYCPDPPRSLVATVIGAGAGAASATVPFVIDNVAALPGSTVAAQIGGDEAVTTSFDWGLPFFFGRSVFVARNNAATPYGTGPYWAF